MSTDKTMKAAVPALILLGLLILLYGFAMLAGGVYLIALGGSWFFAPAGLALALAGGPLLLQVPSSHDDLVALDTALLTDELPIDAYLDSGFHSWLADSSRR